MKHTYPLLNLPTGSLELAEKEGHVKVKCVIRKRWIILTPEEWVRQHFIQYLVREKEFPLSLMKAERQIPVNGTKKRFDLVCYDNRGRMIVLAEFKAASVQLSEATFDQAARYNLELKVPLVIISNGLTHFCAEVNHESGSFSYLNEIPKYEEAMRKSN